MNFTDAKTNKIMSELQQYADNNMDLLDSAMSRALKEAQSNKKETVNPDRIKFFIDLIKETV